jgi:hypothetical protein
VLNLANPLPSYLSTAGPKFWHIASTTTRPQTTTHSISSSLAHCLSYFTFACYAASAVTRDDNHPPLTPSCSMAMHLASMVHGSVREREAFQQPPSSAYYQHAHAHGYTAPSGPSNPYTRQLQQPPQQQHQPSYQREHPQSPPSPPAEEKKPSLPSISSLLEIAGGEHTTSDTGKKSCAKRTFQNQKRTDLTDAAARSPQSQHRQSSSPQPGQAQAQHRGPGAMQQPPQPHSSRSEQTPAHISAPSAVNAHRMTLPPTPPMHPDVAGDGNRSPSAASTHSAASVPYYSGSLNNLEPHQQRQSMASMVPLKRDAAPAHSMSPYATSVYAQSPYASSPSGTSATSFYSPEQHSYSSLGMYQQRPLPSHFQPQGMPLPVPIPSPGATGSNPWQHHHYISTSSQSAFPQSQDRYICSTCNKAFSRPSSLRIHSHSHTGEKPYKCPQPGCGKAFSVRSNMKRHERGCHAATGAALTT